MKRLYMIAAIALLAVGAQAQTLRVFMGSKEIEIGKTTKFAGGEIKDYGASGKDFKYDPELSLMSDQSGVCSLIAECKTGQKIQLCFGGNCMTGTTVEKNGNLTAGVKMPLQFEYMGFTYSADEAIPSDVTTVFTAEQGATVIKFTVIVNPSTNAVTVLQDEYQLPNAGFENKWGDCIPWTSTGNTKAHGTTPSPWCISNVIGINGLGATMTGDKVMGYDSSGAVQITNTANTMLNTVAVPGYVTLGTTWSTSVMNQENDPPHLSSSSPLRRGRYPWVPPFRAPPLHCHRYCPSLAHQVISGLGTSSPTEAREGSPDRGTGSIGRQRISGTAPALSVGGSTC